MTQQRDAVLSGHERSALFLPSQNEIKSECPHMCAYKLVTVKFRWWGLQTKVENIIHKVGPRSVPPAASCILHPLLSVAARKTDFHKLSPPTVLLDRQVGGPDHGGHQADGGRDPKRAGGGTCFTRRATLVPVVAVLLQMLKPL